MAKQTDKASAFVGGVLRGIAAPLDTFKVNSYPYPHASDRDAIQRDLQRVGEDFKTVIANADAEAAD
jgi:hypothetical protein